MSPKILFPVGVTIHLLELSRLLDEFSLSNIFRALRWNLDRLCLCLHHILGHFIVNWGDWRDWRDCWYWFAFQMFHLHSWIHHDVSFLLAFWGNFIEFCIEIKFLELTVIEEGLSFAMISSPDRSVVSFSCWWPMMEDSSLESISDRQLSCSYVLLLQQEWTNVNFVFHLHFTIILLNFATVCINLEPVESHYQMSWSSTVNVNLFSGRASCFEITFFWMTLELIDNFCLEELLKSSSYWTTHMTIFSLCHNWNHQLANLLRCNCHRPTSIADHRWLYLELR